MPPLIRRHLRTLAMALSLVVPDDGTALAATWSDSEVGLDLAPGEQVIVWPRSDHRHRDDHPDRYDHHRTGPTPDDHHRAAAPDR